MTHKRKNVPGRLARKNKPLRVCALLGDTLFPLEYAVAYEVFGLDRPENPDIRYDFTVVALRPGGQARRGGMAVSSCEGLAGLAPCHTIIVPGWPIDQAPHPDIVNAVKAAHQRGTRIASFCSGAFLLAACGVLDDGVATTHWRYADAFRRRFPNVKLDEGSLFVRAGNVFTAAGSAAAIDLALHLVGEDYGASAANSVARRLVAAPVRAGGQAQFIHRPAARLDGAERFTELVNCLPARVDQPLNVDDLAAEAAMSRRSFIRRFKELTGAPPARWIAEQRIQRARELLEQTRLPVEESAAQCGYETVAGFRARFQAVTGLGPRAYRAFFSQARHEDTAS